ncbi:MAG: hypothetical protein MRJ65_17845 [Candidatus Brocadiaceae bacterium]|nr:hypothetical protein [Candidatus Brocadiaceae bacterium]
MKTTWINIHKVLLEEETRQKQQYAQGIPNAAEVGATNINTTKWIYIPLPVSKINAVRLGYQYKRWPTDNRSRITKVRILKMVAPGQAEMVLYEQAVSLNSEAYTFDTITSPPLFSHEGFFLALEISIVDYRDWFLIGPVGIEEHAVVITEANPMDFGAVGDGVVNDSKALKETVLYALANRLPVDLAGRTYRSSETLHIKPAQLEGKGITLRNGKLLYTGCGAAILVDKESTLYTPVHMEDIEISGTSETGLNLGKALNSSFTNVSVAGFQVGLRLRGCNDNEFFSCNFSKNHVNVQIEPYQQTGGRVRSNDNKFWGCTLTNATGIASVYLLDGPEIAGSNNAFYGCRFENSAQHQVLIGNGHGTSLIDCRFEQAFMNPPDLNAPFSMVKLQNGEQTRILGCWFPGMPTNKPEDCLIRVRPTHRGTKIVGCVFLGSQRVLIDDNGTVECYGNWALDNKFSVPSHSHP